MLDYWSKEWHRSTYHRNNKSIAKGKVGTADATFAMLDDDMIAMAQGKLNPQ